MAKKNAKDDFELELEGEEEAKVENNAEIEEEDDTPEEDRGRTPLPEEIVKELEADELEEYSEKVKTKLKQLKKVWHDERREKERAAREQQEALAFAQRMLEENRRLKTTLTEGEQTLVASFKQAAELEAENARRAYREAHDLGDTDKVIEAQEKLASANYRLEQLKSYKPALQGTDTEVENTQTSVQAPRIDPKTVAWQERNTWYGTDPEMTASALGLHQKLEQQHGKDFVGTDKYWETIDATMSRRFPEYFGEGSETGSRNEPSSRETKAANVVAPASRSTSSKKIVLKKSQIDIAKRLGLTPEQYAREMIKMES